MLTDKQEAMLAKMSPGIAKPLREKWEENARRDGCARHLLRYVNPKERPEFRVATSTSYCSQCNSYLDAGETLAYVHGYRHGGGLASDVFPGWRDDK